MTPIPGVSTTIVYGGLTFGVVDDEGVTWRLNRLQGWGSPQSSIVVQDNVRQPGGWAGDAFLTPRTVTVDLTVVAPDPTSLNAALDALHAAVSLGQQQFQVIQAGVARTLQVRRGPTPVMDGRLQSRIAQPSFQVVATDGRKLGVPVTGTTDVASTSGGVTVPVTVPFNIPATTNSGIVALTNDGNTRGPVVLTIQGPLSGPSITHVASGATFTFASSLTLGSAEFLVVDMDAHTALAQGQASRSQYITSRQWFGLDPGVNEFAFTAASASSGCFLTVQATPAWQ